ncbi:MAG TPA: isoleucine--tRNA ligase [Bacteroidia bacterium]|nr:isoleucine--tRNA ligase [Bacteroidia bacterium]HRS59029.1 isoleucine--tRNA ligase [Bacteroidia bacterium]HRU68091.1 isoleucine--tRNA ligase [Bacteroidia bacterium]
MRKYNEYSNYDHFQFEEDVRKFWQENKIFEKSIGLREGQPNFVFYEGPPSANGMPGIHHLLSRTLKDIFCRYKTLKGYQVKRKAGWDTHGLPVEISVEKTLGISKEDIGKSISIEEFNQTCKRDVLKYKNYWDDLTQKMGYWLNLDDPYITFDNKYIESVWWLLKQLFEKGLLYKGYTIQPYSPAAGTGLSTHELNQPGCYKPVKDVSAVVQFKCIRNDKSEFLFQKTDTDVYFLAWTTTPWTLPSNTALALGADITYSLVRSFNPYSGQPITVILAKELIYRYFNEKNENTDFKEYKAGDKNIPFKILGEYQGNELAGISYEQLLPYAQPAGGKAFITVTGDFVTTEDGTGIVHIAPSFGADDMKVARENGLAALTLVDKKGRFTEEMGEFAGRYVKTEYAPEGSQVENVDVDLVVKLKHENKLFKTEKYEHNYPHCWRTDKPILYYPLDSWFIRTTALKDRLIALNRTINWVPESTGLGRFENWLENLVDWNLSRSRFWGTPLPVWMTEDKQESICIGSLVELKAEISKSVQAGFMKNDPLEHYIPGDNSKENYEKFDLHRPYVDEIILVSPSGKKMFREPDLIDVWFDSGAMPYAQFHYPFENQNLKDYFPSDFISEGVDQTRGWFFTLHAIAVMVFDSVSYKNCVSHGLVLDKFGNKMSKRVGNVVDPFEVMKNYGADSTRWYIITNAPPYENLKFDMEGVQETRRKFFGTLYNTYAFFALYANIDGFSYQEEEIPLTDRPEIDRWIISELNSLIAEVEKCYEEYDPTRAGRAIQDFVIDNLSNWYVRLSRRRFWKSAENNHEQNAFRLGTDKLSAYQTLYQCLEVVARLMSPLAPFYAEKLYRDLNNTSHKNPAESVHLTDFPTSKPEYIDKELEERMKLAQDISSMVLSIRKKENIRVRQPLSKILIPVDSEHLKEQIEKVRNLILSETNVKEIEYITNTKGLVVKKVKPDFKALGPKLGKNMKFVTTALSSLSQDEIYELEKSGRIVFDHEGQNIEIEAADLEIISEDIPGWTTANMDNLTVALDITITEALKMEGISRELINRIQNLRKNKDFEVTDHISVEIIQHKEIIPAINMFKDYICSETLTDKLAITEKIEDDFDSVDIEENEVFIRIKKI